MRPVSIDELHTLRRLLDSSAHPSLVAAELSSLRLRAAARADTLAFAVDPSNDDSRYAGTAYRTTLPGSAGQALQVAATVDQYGHLYGIDVSDPSGSALVALPTVVSESGQASLGAPIAAPSVPGRAMGIVGLILTLFPFVGVAGLVVSIVAVAKARRAGSPNAFALAGVIVGALGTLATVAIAAVLLPVLGPIFVDAAETCARLGVGVHEVGNATYRCGYGSFTVSWGPYLLGFPAGGPPCSSGNGRPSSSCGADRSHCEVHAAAAQAGTAQVALPPPARAALA